MIILNVLFFAWGVTIIAAGTADKLTWAMTLANAVAIILISGRK